MSNFPQSPHTPFADGRVYLTPHRGTLILVLGILSLIVCPPLGIAAWIMGNTDLRAMREGRMDPTGESLTTAGKICGIIASILLCLGVLLSCGYFLIVMLFLGAAAAGAAGSTP